MLKADQSLLNYPLSYQMKKTEPAFSFWAIRSMLDISLINSPMDNDLVMSKRSPDS
jgi:hypothetical protein